MVDVEREGSKRERKFIGRYRLKKDADAAEAKAKAQRVEGTLDTTPPKKITVNELFNEYLELREVECAEKTVERYKEIFDLHVRPAFGTHQARRLSADQIEKHLASLRRSGLSDRTVHHVFTVWKAAFRWAEQKQKILRSPFISVDAPKVAPREARYLTPEEADKLLDAARGTPWYAPLVIALTTALRRGEVCGLQWDAVDLDARVIVVRASLTDAYGKHKLKGPKGNRIERVSLSTLAVETLRARHAELAAEKLASKPELYVDRGFVFCDSHTGEPIKLDTLTKAFRRLATQAQITGRTLHSLRHSTGTWMIANGADIVSVQKVLRHSKASTTVNIYAHAVAGLQEKAVATIDASLAAAHAQRRPA
jgi:integrase